MYDLIDATLKQVNVLGELHSTEVLPEVHVGKDHILTSSTPQVAHTNQQTVGSAYTTCDH